MNKLITMFAATALLLCANTSVAAPTLAVVPKPQTVRFETGADVSLGSALVVPKGDQALRDVAELFASAVAREEGFKFKTTPKSTANAIELAIDAQLAAEAYRLTAGNHSVRIEGGSAAGVFYGLQTLRQMLAQYGRTIPAVVIEDEPFFAYRGTMLDCCRHFFSVDEVKSFIDIIAMHKINRFHWHLTEDQGWRIEIKRYPELTKIGSKRSQTVIGRNTDEYDGKPYGGYYTQNQIREVVAYAAERFITIVPEIEMPGHSSAALTAYPWLGCTGKDYFVQTRWGVFPEVYCAGKETTFEFMENVLAEVLELFPSKYIHIGGDECPKESWKVCPACQQRIKENGLKNEFELQSYFVHRMEKWLNERGRNLIGWDEILEGGISQTATVMSWRGAEGGIAAAKAGNMVVMTPNTHCYLDYFQTANAEQNEPLGIGGYLPVSKVYELDPYDKLTPDERRYILGVQANLWTEYIPTFEHAQHMLLPRLAAVAEVGWAYDRKDYTDFCARLSSLHKLYGENGYNFATYFFDGIDEKK